MEATDPITKHRLELLERTVYALQAQHRLLEYRIQYIEGESKALRVQTAQGGDPPVTKQPPPSGSHQTAIVHHSCDLSDLVSFPVDEEPNEEHSTSQPVNIPTSQSILDEPSPISTPVLNPARMKRSVSSLRNSVANAIPFIPARVEASIKSPTKANETVTNGSATEASSEIWQRRKTPVPWDGTISWKILNIFRDSQEEKQAIHNAALMIGDGKLEDQWIFQYGLRYLPQPDDSDAYRTVRVEGLPRDITMDKLLAAVCYGDVYSIDLLNTFGVTGYHTARVVFLHQKSAFDFCKHAKKRGVYVQGVRIRATREKTATYPIGRGMRDAIGNHGCTRCVTIAKVDSSLLFARVKTLIEESFLKYSTEVLDQEGDTIHIRFHSMRAASFACQSLKSDRAFDHCWIDYSKDPCNRVPGI
ncbi:hypothetical protein PISL3812_08266 [Talaromyces islandicus]|uniref:Uncharacterized protein n=1 Tax=Talaromyces islandicus TaxID=28573 RepID=A0A0U1M6R8_TALIS|nr:hypothetical protein PISL3812_08266 [Talaromyces islandicus]